MLSFLIVFSPRDDWTRVVGQSILMGDCPQLTTAGGNGERKEGVPMSGMIGQRKWAWTAVLALISASPVAAQQGGVSSGGQPSGLGLGSGSGALSSSGLAGGLNSGSYGSGSGVGAGGIGSSSGSNGGMGTTGQQPQGLATGGIAPVTGGQSTSLQSSNIFSGYYANPYYQGLGTGQGAPGGFGSPLYNGTGTGTTAGGRAGGTSTLGGLGGSRGGLGGIGGQNSANQSGIVIPVQVQMTYASEMRFPTQPPATTRVHTELRSALDNSSMITGKTVQVVTDANNNVTLRGSVKDEDEARLVEGIVRLTPGVGEIKNEITFPVAGR